MQWGYDVRWFPDSGFPPERGMMDKKQARVDLPSGKGTISTRAEQKQVEDRQAIGANVVYETIRREGEEELHRPAAALAWSALAAGLSMGFSFIAQGVLMAHLPDQPWRPLIAGTGYCVGFLIVILGRQQLFTENTLTVVLPLLITERFVHIAAHASFVGRGTGRESCWNILVRFVRRKNRHLRCAHPTVFDRDWRHPHWSRFLDSVCAIHFRGLVDRIDGMASSRRRIGASQHHHNCDLFGRNQWI